MSENISFGDYLKKLIKDAGMTQHKFYTALGITKPYFYDILSGRVNPPPPELQFRAMEILKADSDARKLFFDLAAKGRKDMPADVAKWVIDNPKAIESIRNRMDQSSTGGQKNG